MSGIVTLRNVLEDDLQTLFEQQHDPLANRMAAFPARDKDAFFAHWKKILATDPEAKQTIVFDGKVAGLVISWEQSGKRLIGYWIGKDFWGKGIATRALSIYLGAISVRPLYAFVAKHNLGSIRVLEKCGFSASGAGTFFSEVHGHEMDEVVYGLTESKSGLPLRAKHCVDTGGNQLEPGRRELGGAF